MADNYIENKYEQYQARKAAWQKSGMKKKKTSTAHTSAVGSGMQKTYLQSHVKRVAAVHDLSGAGRVSLMAVIPILSSMGIQVCPLPTAVLSAHTQYPHYSFLDLTEEMKRIIESWEKLDMKFLSSALFKCPWFPTCKLHLLSSLLSRRSIRECGLKRLH